MEKITSTNNHPKIFLVVPNPSKTNNIGPILRCAAAFSVKEVVIVGFKKFSTHGAHGSNKHVMIQHFYEYFEALAHLKRQDCSIYGLLSEKNCMIPSISVSSRTFGGKNIALVIGHKKDQLSEEQKEICENFIDIDPCFDSNVELDISIRLGIALHHFTAWGNFEERDLKGEKFEVDNIYGAKSTFGCSDDKVSEERKNKLAEYLDFDPLDGNGAFCSIFEEGEDF